LVALLLAMAAGLAAPREASAQTLTLRVNPRNITFPNADPDVSPFVLAPAIVVTIRVRQNGGNPWNLSVMADGDLTAGAATIDINNVSWTGTPSPPFQSGTLSRTLPQTMAAGTGNVNPALDGSVVFRLVNSWSYPSGNYSQTVVFTLSAP